MEFRNNGRVPVDYQVWYTTPDQTVEKGTMYDLSPGGCAVSTVGAVEPGARLALTILDPDQPIPITVESASVRWTVLGEFGVEFEGLTEHDRTRLSQLLTRAMRNLSDFGRR
ncbi:hypothetical protein YTPLAS18_29710 [Nitrospira sp.]|nr:hypothetical protein YTPLAS18_29710 [Nitrospira sp.]